MVVLATTVVDMIQVLSFTGDNHAMTVTNLIRASWLSPRNSSS
jgi:hypothetical protein